MKTFRQQKKEKEEWEKTFGKAKTGSGEEQIFKPNPNATTSATPEAAGTRVEGDAARVLKKEAGGGPAVNVNNPDVHSVVFTAQNANGVVSNFTQFPEYMQYKLNTGE